MATLKIKGLTFFQSNALTQAFEYGDKQVLDSINNYLENMGVPIIEEIQQVTYDEFNQGDNEIEL